MDAALCDGDAGGDGEGGGAQVEYGEVAPISVSEFKLIRVIYGARQGKRRANGLDFGDELGLLPP